MFTGLEYCLDGLSYSIGRKELSADFWPNLDYVKGLLFLYVGWCVQFVCLFPFMWWHGVLKLTFQTQTCITRQIQNLNGMQWVAAHQPISVTVRNPAIPVFYKAKVRFLVYYKTSPDFSLQSEFVNVERILSYHMGCWGGVTNCTMRFRIRFFDPIISVS